MAAVAVKTASIPGLMEAGEKYMNARAQLCAELKNGQAQIVLSRIDFGKVYTAPSLAYLPKTFNAKLLITPRGELVEAKARSDAAGEQGPAEEASSLTARRNLTAGTSGEAGGSSDGLRQRHVAGSSKPARMESKEEEGEVAAADTDKKKDVTATAVAPRKHAAMIAGPASEDPVHWFGPRVSPRMLKAASYFAAVMQAMPLLLKSQQSLLSLLGEEETEGTVGRSEKAGGAASASSATSSVSSPALKKP